MTVDNPGGSGLDWTRSELLEMSERTARQSLTVDEYEYWEKLQDLYEQADETTEEWDRQAETVADVTVNADMEAIGVRVDVFGNNLLVHADPESREFRHAVERLESLEADLNAQADRDGDELELSSVDDALLDELAGHLLEMLDTVLVKWGDVEWSSLPDGQKDQILADARERWGVLGLQYAWMEIGGAIQADREEKVGRIEKFRNPERSGNR